jgi:hypothetical protein
MSGILGAFVKTGGDSAGLARASPLRVGARIAIESVLFKSLKGLDQPLCGERRSSQL